MALWSPQNLRNNFYNVVNHKETNVIVTALVVFVALYISLLSILHRNIADPLAVPIGPVGFHPKTLPLDNGTDEFAVIRADIEDGVSILSLFFLWVLSLCLGRLCSYVCLPSLLGMLVAGILIRNVEPFSTFWQIDATYERLISQLAYIIILIRCAVNIEPKMLQRTLGLFTSVGLLSALAETAAIVLAAHFLFGVPIAVAILFGFILAANSPAVSVPSMIRAQDQGRGAANGVPSAVFGAVYVDNIFCITAGLIVSSVVFVKNEDLWYLVPRVIIEILMGALIGILLGLLLRIFPRRDADMVHFVRSVVICTVSVAALFGSRAIGCELVGPIAIFLLCFVAAMRWRVDNHCGPLQFAVIGLLLDFSTLTWSTLADALCIIFIGMVVRSLAVFVLSVLGPMDWREKLFLSVCFVPKATVQAAFIRYGLSRYSIQLDADVADTVLQTLVLSVIIGAPLGQILINLCARLLLEKHVEVEKRPLPPLSLPPMPKRGMEPPKMGFGGEREPSFLISDADNRLRLKVNGKTAPIAAETPKPPPSPTPFEKINQQAFEIFKEQRLKAHKSPQSPLGTIDEIESVRSVAPSPLKAKF